MSKFKYFFLIGLLLINVAIAAPQPLPADEAFQFSASVKNPHTITAHWDIAKGYHLYRDSFCFKILSPDNVHLSKIKIPKGISQETALGPTTILNNAVNIDIPIPSSPASMITLMSCYQGCSDTNFCYPPMLKEVTLNLTKIGESSGGITLKQAYQTKEETTPPQSKMTTFLETHSFSWVLLTFFGFGLLLSLTPCVLPMLPILSGLIVGHGKNITTKKAFFLSLTYVLSMSVTYAIAGVFAASMGYALQARLQNPWVIALFSFIFVLLALSLFDFYQLELPQKWREKITVVSNHQKSGSYIGVAIMGCLATLLVSPCVTPPLVGALAYISQTGNPWLGGAALFVMALGMGVPLLLVGTSHGRLLPKAGPFMRAVKNSLGVLMLAVALWMLGRILPAWIMLGLWGGLFLICSIYLGLLKQADKGWQQFKRGIALIFAIYGILLIIGFALGNENIFAPLSKATASKTLPNQPMLAVTRIKTIDELQQALKESEKNDQMTLVDFYARWCVACKEMEATTFRDPKVIAALANIHVVQADISVQNHDAIQLMQKYTVIAPPTLLFFDPQDHEIKNARVVGAIDAEALLAVISQLPQDNHISNTYTAILHPKTSL